MEKKKRELLNPKKEPLTVEKLREMTGQNYSDEEAKEIVANIKAFSALLVQQMLEEEQSESKAV